MCIPAASCMHTHTSGITHAYTCQTQIPATHHKSIHKQTRNTKRYTLQTTHPPHTESHTHTRMTTTAMHIYSIWSHCTLALYYGTTRQTTGTTHHPITTTLLKKLLTNTHTHWLYIECMHIQARTHTGWLAITYTFRHPRLYMCSTCMSNLLTSVSFVIIAPRTHAKRCSNTIVIKTAAGQMLEII